MKSLRRKVFISILTVMICFITLGTSTFAWFSMNNKVTVTGMTVTTKVENNLAIAATSADNNKVADSVFQNALHQTISAAVQPVSTIDGTNFFYTNDAAEDGHKVGDNAFTALPASNIITVSGVDYNGYVDYVFELKATNTNPTDPAHLLLSKLNLLYNGADATTHAFRVAIFIQEETSAFSSATADARAAAYSNAYGSIATVADKFFAKTGYAYFDSKAVASTTTTAAVSASLNSAVTKTIAANSTKYFKVTVRLWLEGQDTDCYNTKFVALTDAWTLDLAFTLESATTNAITTLGSVANASIESNGTKLTAALTNGESAVAYQWYKSDGTIQSGQTDAEFTPADDAAYYCVITTSKGNVYNTSALAK